MRFRLTLRTWWSWGLLVALTLVCALGSSGRAEAAGAFNVFSVPDRGGFTGAYISLVLDVSGYPVVSYQEFGFDHDLRILHCNDPDCTGGDETETEPDTTGDVGMWTSLALDASGNPVVSYYDNTNGNLKVMHCNDPGCAGNDESITSPDTVGQVGYRTSLVLDAAGNPVIVHQDVTQYDFHVVHCNDPDCAGSDESITSPDPAGQSSPASRRAIALDMAGNPIIAYQDFSINQDLKVMHCDDPNCAGGNESITSPDTPGYSGDGASIVLDGSGNPIIAHHDTLTSDLRVVHCNDPDCSGGDESITAPDTDHLTGASPYVVLNSAGNPVIAYEGKLPTRPVWDLRVLTCNDPDCAGGDDTIGMHEISGGNHQIQLDDTDSPIMAFTSFGMAVLHCWDELCSPDVDADNCADTREQWNFYSGLEYNGGFRNPKDPHDYFNPTGDGQNRVDDVLAVVDAYYKDDTDGNPGLPPYAPGDNPDTDRTLTGPQAWRTGPPNGLQRIDDVLYQLSQYSHDCA